MYRAGCEEEDGCSSGNHSYTHTRTDALEKFIGAGGGSGGWRLWFVCAHDEDESERERTVLNLKSVAVLWAMVWDDAAAADAGSIRFLLK